MRGAIRLVDVRHIRHPEMPARDLQQTALIKWERLIDYYFPRLGYNDNSLV